MVLRLLENALVSQKIGSVHFYLSPQAKDSPRSLSLPLQAGENYPLPLINIFFKSIFPNEKEGRFMEQKKFPKLKLRAYWSQVLINSTIFATLCLWFLFCCTIIKIYTC